MWKWKDVEPVLVSIRRLLTKEYEIDDLDVFRTSMTAVADGIYGVVLTVRRLSHRTVRCRLFDKWSRHRKVSLSVQRISKMVK